MTTKRQVPYSARVFALNYVPIKGTLCSRHRVRAVIETHRLTPRYAAGNRGFRGDALALYRAVTVSEVVGQIEHIRTLLRQVRPKTRPRTSPIRTTRANA